MNKCVKCKLDKPTKDFYTIGKYLDSSCKDCRKKKVIERYYSKEGRKKIKAYEYTRARNPQRKQKRKSYCAKWRKNNIEKNRLIQHTYKEHCKKLGIKEFSLEGKEKYRKSALARYHKRYKTDINYTLAVSLRNRTRMAIKSRQKSGSAVKDLGCKISKLRKYIENKFVDDMNWNNWGKWHIDHIKPLASFNLSNREEFLRAVHYSNLQPLWKLENLKKSNHY